MGRYFEKGLTQPLSLTPFIIINANVGDLSSEDQQKLKRDKGFWTIAKALEGPEDKTAPPPQPEVYYKRNAIYRAYKIGLDKQNAELEEMNLRMIERRRLATKLLPTQKLREAARKDPELLFPAQRFMPTWTPPLFPMFVPKKASKDIEAQAE